MKLELKVSKTRIDWRKAAIALSFSISFCLAPVIAQLKSPKHINSVWTSNAADGSWVTVTSDASLSDYEAYRRADRFYVKIPMADLPSAKGILPGRGFDDAEIQRYGDAVIFSFHLLPGTTAHVDQKPNRLEIIFTTPGRSPSAGPAAGPTPPSSFAENIKARASETRVSVAEAGRAANTWQGHRSTRKNRTSPSTVPGGQGARNASSGNDQASARPTPIGAATRSGPPSSAASPPSPTSISGTSPSTSQSGSTAPSISTSGSPDSMVTPTARQSSFANPAPVSSNREASNWSDRIHYYKVWAQLNWLPLLIAGLVFVCLVALLSASRRRSKRRQVVIVGSAKKAPPPAETAVSRQSPPVKTAEPARLEPMKWFAAGSTSRPNEAAPQTSKPFYSSLARAGYAEQEQEREVFEI
jgi:hypothetical protein